MAVLMNGGNQSGFIADDIESAESSNKVAAALILLRLFQWGV